MRKFIVMTIACTFLSVNNAAGKVSEVAIKQHVQQFKENLTTAINTFITSANTKSLEYLEKMLPETPDKVGPKRIEKDIFANNLEESVATLEILENKIDNLKEKQKELKKLLKSQKKVRNEWKKFWR